MAWDAFIKIFLLTLGLGIALFFSIRWFVYYSARKHPERMDEKYTSRLSGREAFQGIFIGAVVVVVIASLHILAYPWLGVPVMGQTGVAPFLEAIFLVYGVLFAFRYFRNNAKLHWSVSVLGGIALATLVLWYLGAYHGNEMQVLFSRP